MALSGSRLDVMRHVGENLDTLLGDYLKPIETNWQPSDFLPDSRQEDFPEQVRLFRESARELSYDYMAVLVGDTITEEALPTYESWLMDMEGVNQAEPTGWTSWIRGWTAEENRHGDLLNKFLYLSGRVNMRAMEVSTQYLIADGFDIGTGTDPYKNFVYTSFQELATNVSHRRTATLAKQAGCPQLSKICGVIASDEMRHAKAYKAFVSKIFEVDPSEMMLAFEEMMRKKIVMPAHFLRETGVKLSQTFSHFSDAAQRIGVYTTNDYIDIIDALLIDWHIDAVTDLNDAGQRARDYLMALPARLRRVADRTKIPTLEYPFSWIAA
ncbi:acyl-[acyl-carrier-protein] desaturase [Spirosoma oryzae]|jgi:acyl-[acyl-carrier-protein] desaturase|uniref:Acyl-[acyl-carrier-protein] desaturase n=2 Tax=Spirosoma oryzae TaxID=1469603 RepID=A0A2T0T600_9BACT|nr:acyl-ACP desaturase [Spirosoma oryzae]PRY41086.1 acyl-[acyl-carrier-protein] desaturase [Spirosoma oryzae]